MNTLFDEKNHIRPEVFSDSVMDEVAQYISGGRRLSTGKLRQYYNAFADISGELLRQKEEDRKTAWKKSVIALRLLASHMQYDFNRASSKELTWNFVLFVKDLINQAISAEEREQREEEGKTGDRLYEVKQYFESVVGYAIGYTKK